MSAPPSWYWPALLLRACVISLSRSGYSPLLLGAPPPSPPADGVAIEAAELRPLAAAETPALAAIAPTAMPPGPPAAPPATKPMVRAERTKDEGRFMPK